MIEYIDDDLYTVSCALPDLGVVLRTSAALAAVVVVAGAAVVLLINRLRLW